MSGRVQISVISSVYNNQMFIGQMIESILRQTFVELELIIINDASTDNTEKVIRSYMAHDRRIKLHNNIQNKGLTKNLNEAIKHCQGNYIARIDGDDIAFLNRLEQQYLFMEKNPHVILCGCQAKQIGMANKIFPNNSSEAELKCGILFNTILPHPTFFFRKELTDFYEQYYNSKFRYAQDYYFLYQTLNKGNVALIPEVLQYYRMYKQQISYKKSDEQLTCARTIRKIILKELFDLNQIQIDIWNLFCERKKINLITYPILRSIIQKMLSINQRNQFFDQLVLKNRLKAELNIKMLRSI